jgi:hypothetical protein
MKMGTTASSWRYDVAARHTLQSVNLRRPTILRTALRTDVFPISQGDPVAALSINRGIDVMGQIIR